MKAPTKLIAAVSPPIINRLFLAFIPSLSTIDLISELAVALRQQYGLKAQPRPSTHFHITLQWLGDFPEVPDALVSGATKACATLARQTAPFEIHLDRVLSFRKPSGNHPLVLAGNEEHNPALFQFQKRLVSELARAVPLPKDSRRKFKPHLTLMYDRQDVAEAPIAPVRWKADEFRLIHSEVGATRHHHLASWKLCGSESPTLHTPDLFG
ncbi:2'-5' RNA ligase family protein [Roseimicrobium gellanilyticum]|uniref:2'-5' RNA ligase family protein n=1 Tax=Roseimicrobium gellanilyticum TaxID=748857 RepID=UPI00147577F3|nr:2'-5' RNA ligase family protein [Roseimicrobium gellanilyticum]